MLLAFLATDTKKDLVHQNYQAISSFLIITSKILGHIVMKQFTYFCHNYRLLSFKPDIIQICIYAHHSLYSVTLIKRKLCITDVSTKLYHFSHMYCDIL